MLTVPLVLAPPTTDGDSSVKLDIVGKFTLKVAEREAPFRVAVSVTSVAALTGFDLTTKVAKSVGRNCLRCGNNYRNAAVCGKRYNVPGRSAGDVSPSVATNTRPPITEESDKERPETEAGSMARVVVFEKDSKEAVIVTRDAELTGAVVAANVAVVALASIVTAAGTLAFGLLEDKVTVVPPAGAGAVRVTSPVDTFPPANTEGKPPQSNPTINNLKTMPAETPAEPYWPP